MKFTLLFYWICSVEIKGKRIGHTTNHVAIACILNVLRYVPYSVFDRGGGDQSSKDWHHSWLNRTYTIAIILVKCSNMYQYEWGFVLLIGQLCRDQRKRDRPPPRTHSDLYNQLLLYQNWWAECKDERTGKDTLFFTKSTLSFHVLWYIT